MPHGRDALFGTASEAIVGEVPRERSILSSIVSKVSTEEGEVAPPIASKTACGEEGSQGTRGSTELMKACNERLLSCWGSCLM